MSPFPLFSRFRSSCFAFSGAAAVSLTAFVPTQAQTPTFNVAEYAEYNANIDDAAASFAANLARRADDAPVPNAERPLTPAPNVQNRANRQNFAAPSNATRRSAPASTRSNVRSNAPKSQTAQTWEAFIFGTPNRPRSTPKFAFAQRDPLPSEPRVSRPASSAQPLQTLQTPSNLQAAQSSQRVQTAQTARPAQTTQTAQALQLSQTAQTNVSATDAEIAAARRRRLQELNALLAARRPEEFSRRLALAGFASPFSASTLPFDDAENSQYNGYNGYNEPVTAAVPAFPLLVAEPTADRSAVALRDRAEFVRESDAAPFDAARANRSKIRQASNFESAEPLELADDGLATFLLPTRPNALRLSPNVFLSTDLVRLPSAAPLCEAAENAPNAQTSQPSPLTQTHQPAQPAQTAQPRQTTQPAQPPQPSQTVQSSQTIQPLQETQTPATVATPLPAASSTDVPTLRPTAQFVEPRFLPTSR